MDIEYTPNTLDLKIQELSRQVRDLQEIFLMAFRGGIPVEYFESKLLDLEENYHKEA